MINSSACVKIADMAELVFELGPGFRVRLSDHVTDL